MLLEEHIAHINNLLNMGVPPDDNPIQDRHIYFVLKYIRLRLIRQRVDKFQYLSSYNYQTLSCIPLKAASFDECCDCGIPQEVPLKKSVCSIPKMLTYRNNDVIRSVRTPGGLDIPRTSPTRIYYDLNSRVRKGKLAYFINGEHLYTANDLLLDQFNIEAVFEDPRAIEEVAKCQDCEHVCCSDLTVEDFPIDPDLVHALNNLTLEELVKYRGYSTDDKENDALYEQLSRGSNQVMPLNRGTSTNAQEEA